MEKKDFEMIRQEAVNIYSHLVSQGYTFDAVYEYRDEPDRVFDYKLRFIHESKGKEIRYMYYDEAAKKYVAKQKKIKGQKRPLYKLTDLFNSNHPVFVCEGEKCVDTLINLGILATTSGSAQSAAQANWQPLMKRKIIIWPDNDKAGKDYADTVGKILFNLGCQVSITDINKLELAEKEDAVDWIRSNPGATVQTILALPTIEYVAPIKPSNEKERKATLATLALECVRENWELFHDANRKVYGRNKTTGEIYLIEDKLFIDGLAALLYKQRKVILNDHVKKSILQVLRGEGLYDSPCYEVFLRVAVYEGCYYIDLAEVGKSRAIEVSVGKWTIIDKPPIRFVRSSSMRSLPEPAYQNSECKLSLLWDIINIPERARLLVLAWLLECFRPETPYPVLELIGEQGSAKSTTQKILRQLIDPNVVDLRGAPKNCDDIAVSTQQNHVISYENLSHLHQDMQDKLCVIATGGGHAKRELYADANELILQCKNPIMLNGINEVITSQDLVSRAISIELPTITKRQEVNKIDTIFKQYHAILFDALLDLFAKSIERLPDVHLPEEEQPRLIEFVRFGMAVAEVLGVGGNAFLIQYNEMNKGSIERALDASPVAVAILSFIDSGCPSGFRRLSMKDFFAEVSQYKPSSAYSSSWPHSPRGFSNALRRIMPALRAQGVQIEKLGKIGGNSMLTINDGRIAP